MTSLLENAKRLSNLKMAQTLPAHKRYIYEEMAQSSAKITAVYGGRGVGKTTILMQLLHASPLPPSQKLYIACDHAMFSGVGLFDFVDEFCKRGGELICIDEIHESPEFERTLKSIYDFLDIKVYFTGSSAIHLRSPDFARRYSMYHLHPLSFREYLVLSFGADLRTYALEEILKEHEGNALEILDSLQDKKILKHFNTFLQVGAYPFYFEDPSRYTDRINEMINTVLHTDLSRLFAIQSDKIDTLKKLLLTLCVSKPLEFSMDKLAATVGITKSTLYKYIHYLDDAKLIHQVTHEAKRFASIRKSDKLYLSNPNLFGALCIQQEIGTIRESYFASQLSVRHRLRYVDRGDFLVDERYVFEIGGRHKSFEQIKDRPDSFIAADEIETGFGNKIPLWLFGFIY